MNISRWTSIKTCVTELLGSLKDIKWAQNRERERERERERDRERETDREREAERERETERQRERKRDRWGNARKRSRQGK